MKTITVLSYKRGAGKTTVCLSLALAARQAGLKVVLADVDPMRAATEVMRYRPEAASMLIDARAAKLGLLQDAARSNGCDLLIVDTPAGPEADIKLAVEIADLSLAVARPTPFDLPAARRTARFLRQTGAPGLFVMNRCRPRRSEARSGLVRALETRLFGGIPLARTRLRHRDPYRHAFAQQSGVTELNPWNEFAGDVRRLLAETAGGLLLARPDNRAALAGRADPTFPASPDLSRFVEGPPSAELSGLLDVLGKGAPPTSATPATAEPAQRDDDTAPSFGPWQGLRAEAPSDFHHRTAA